MNLEKRVEGWNEHITRILGIPWGFLIGAELIIAQSPFRVTPQPGVPPEEAGAGVAAESSTGTWTTVWTDGLTGLDRYKGRCYHIDTCEEMIKRAVFARELGVPIVMHDYLTGDSLANTSLAHYCRDNGLLLHIHRAMHAVIDRQKNHGMHFRVLAKALHLSGGDHISAGTVVGKLEGEREITLGFVDLLRDDYIEKDRSRGIYFTQDWVSMRKHVYEARNEGRDLAREGNEIIRRASKWSNELAAACEVWKEIKFEFPRMDTL
ncbi:hypothetical protein K1719_037414 [Acacia pycnantha]|nr:hypothetical protein K1719_037414 [Acacia pycnantha]